MSKPVVYCLHGFLGSGRDWQKTLDYVRADIQAVTPSCFEPVYDFESRLHILSESVCSVFVGYSWGGRQGLKILEQTPDLFQHYIFISTHSGLPVEARDEREQRLQNDLAWVKRLETLSDVEFMKLWNSQEVFKGGAENQSDLQNFDKNLLKKALIEDSLALQKDYSTLLKTHHNKITWVTGEKDAKFLNLADRLFAEGAIQDRRILSGGHRLLNDNPAGLGGIIQEIISLVKVN